MISGAGDGIRTLDPNLGKVAQKFEADPGQTARNSAHAHYSTPHRFLPDDSDMIPEAHPAFKALTTKIPPSL